MTMRWSRRRRVEERLAELRFELDALGPEPTDPLGRWRHQEACWRLRREMERLAGDRRPVVESLPA